MQATPDFALLFVKMTAGLILVLVLAVVLIRYVLPKTRIGSWGKRYGGWATVVGRLTLEPRKSLCLVKVAERYFILGMTEGTLSLVS